MLFGWPVLGAISKAKEVTITTILAAVVQITGLAVLIIFSKFTLVSIALVRCFSESVLLSTRLRMCIKYKNEFD